MTEENQNAVSTVALTSDAAGEVELLQTERARHLNMMRDLTVRAGFVALTFSGVLLLSAINARGTMSELTADYLNKFAEKNGEVLRQQMENIPLITKKKLDGMDLEIQGVLAEQIAELTAKSILPTPSWHVHLAIWISGIGIALAIKGLIGSTIVHIDIAQDIEKRIKVLHGMTKPTSSDLFDQWPHRGIGAVTHTTEVFVGLGCLVVASELTALLLIFKASDALWLELGAAGPSVAVLFWYLIVRTVSRWSR